MQYLSITVFVFLCCSAPVFAQNNPVNPKVDTVRTQQADNWEHVQIRQGDYLMGDGYLHKGVQEGVWNTYWENGFPLELTTYRNGRRNGLHIRTGRDGYTEYMENFSNDTLDGLRRTYKPGIGQQEEVYYKSGKRQGPYTKWYMTAKKQEESGYKEDKRDGKTVWYYENGQKAAEYNYVNGSIEGTATTFHSNGKINETGIYQNNDQTGTWKEYYDNGNLKSEGKYINGEKEGAWKEYNEQGKYTRSVKYQKGTAVR